MKSALHKIVVVGGGAGGLELAARLGRTLGRRNKACPILVDSSLTHIWKPLLPEVASGALNTGEDEVNYFSHAAKNGYKFEYGRMKGLDRTNKLIKLRAVRGGDGIEYIKPRDIHYDTLVMAVGSTSNDFGTPGVSEHCRCLNTPTDAAFIRRKILGNCLSVVSGNTPKLRVGIVGGGATGVELASEIHHTVYYLKNYGGSALQGKLEITIMEGMNRILNMAPENLSAFATEELRRRNIEVKTNCVIKEVTKDGFVFKDGNILQADVKIWTAGIKAPDWLKTLGLPVSNTSQIIVNDRMECIEDSSIYGIGDCSRAPDVKNKNPDTFLPPTAQVAHQQAEWLVGQLTARLENRKCKPFAYSPKGIVVSLGERTAAASLVLMPGPDKRLNFEGKSAKALYSSIYLMHQAVLHGWPRTIMLWLGSKLRNVGGPPVKLH